MPTKTITRIIMDILIALSVVEGWWFVALPLALIGVWYFSFYIEAVIAGVAFDALFGMAASQGVSGYLGIIISGVGSFIVIAAKKVLRR